MKNRHIYFEGLRGVLALIVVIHHFILLFVPEIYTGSFRIEDFKTNAYSFNLIIANTPLNIFMNGNWAVCMFFTLSGFVLSLQYLKSNDTKVLQLGIAKRYLRLVLPILGACLFVFLLYLLGVFKNTFYPRSLELYSFGKNLFLNDLSFFEVIKMALVNVPLNADNTYLPILWTMGVEFLGALLLFTFLLSTHQFKNKWIYYFIMFLILFLINKNYILLFFIGSFTATFEEQIKKIFKRNYIKIILLITAIYFSGIPNIQNDAKQNTIYFFTTFFSPNIYLYFHVISCFLFFVFFISSHLVKKLFSTNILIFFGKISFSLYLTHLPILFVIGSYFLKKSSGQINHLLLFGICFCVIIAVSYVFYKLIDSKAVLLTNKFVKSFIKTI